MGWIFLGSGDRRKDEELVEITQRNFEAWVGRLGS